MATSSLSFPFPIEDTRDELNKSQNFFMFTACVNFRSSFPVRATYFLWKNRKTKED